MLSEDVVRYALAQFKQQLQERLEGTRSRFAVLRTERERLKEEISNLTGVIATGRHSPALLAELAKRERRLDEINDELLASDGRGIDARLREIEDFVLSRLKDLNALLAGEIPKGEGRDGKALHGYYADAGRKDLQTQRRVALLGVVVRSDGAGGQTCTILAQAMFFVDLAA